MRSSRFAPMLLGAYAAAALIAGNAPAPEDDPKRPSPEEERQKAAAERGRLARELAAPASRRLTEVDNTRLREAAEKRFRKAQRQAKGMRPVTTAPASAGQSAILNDQVHDEQNLLQSPRGEA